MCHIHTSIVSMHLATRGNNKILPTPPSHIISSEEILSRFTRHTLSQLRTNKSPFLKSYLHKVDAKSHPSLLCPRCNTHIHNTHHLLNITHIRTTLSPLDLWTDPAKVTALLARWTEKLVGEASGKIGLPPPTSNGRQQQLYQFSRIPFGVTNGIAVFQRPMDKIIREEQLKDTFPYLDDITVAGLIQEEHDSNVKAFFEVVQRRHLTLSHSKSVLSALSITVLEYLVEHGGINTDPYRLHPLQNLPPPHLYVHSAEPWACLHTTQNGYLISQIRLQL